MTPSEETISRLQNELLAAAKSLPAEFRKVRAAADPETRIASAAWAAHERLKAIGRSVRDLSDDVFDRVAVLSQMSVAARQRAENLNDWFNGPGAEREARVLDGLLKLRGQFEALGACTTLHPRAYAVRIKQIDRLKSVLPAMDELMDLISAHRAAFHDEKLMVALLDECSRQLQAARELRREYMMKRAELPVARDLHERLKRVLVDAAIRIATVGKAMFYGQPTAYNFEKLEEEARRPPKTRRLAKPDQATA